MKMHKVLSTKKLEPSLVEHAGLTGVDITEQEFISIKPVWTQETFDKILGLAKSGSLHVAFTSANAVDTLNSYMANHDAYYIIPWKIYCLSGKTKQAVLSAKFLEKNIVGEGGNAIELADTIIADRPKEIVFFCGNRRRNELPDRLKEAGIKLTEIVVYETMETPSRINNEFDAVLFFSPSGVQSFFSVNEVKKETVCFAFGPTTANSLATFTTNKIVTSISADQQMFVNDVINYFDQKANV